uniref:ASCH domain-containing protein n=1 Tax=Panagrellus redivivus TaxID=6233 RepID=A0A7E4V6N8_PANRE
MRLQAIPELVFWTATQLSASFRTAPMGKTLFQRGVYRLEHQQAKLGSMTDGVFTAVSTHSEFICEVLAPEPCTVTADSELDEGYTRLPPLDEDDYWGEYDN